jgi:hypothetical protein
MGVEEMILRCFVRLLFAGGLALLGLLLAVQNQWGEPNDVGVLLGIVGIGWGIVEMFILSALLFTYGITGLFHDIGQSQDHDPWHRW